ncbi:hypothetical protein BIV19_13525 [Intestinimonas butyriciproducens]|nr:hypothetical protein BIV19_13525 [Intestinimonas butyriciproducens]
MLLGGYGLYTGHARRFFYGLLSLFPGGAAERCLLTICLADLGFLGLHLLIPAAAWAAGANGRAMKQPGPRRRAGTRPQSARGMTVKKGPGTAYFIGREAV